LKRKNYNVIYFFADEMRADAIGCYGNKAGAMITPNIDSIASQGVRFEECYCTSPVCVPSRTSILTGLYPEDTGVYGNEASLPPFQLEHELETIPSVLEKQGYRTASFGKTHLPYGMEVFEVNDQEGSEMDLGLGVEQLQGLDKITANGPIRQNLGSRFPENTFYKPEMAAKNSIEWLKNVGDEPFFLRVSFLQPHTPVVVPDQYASLYDHINFDTEIMPTDHLSCYEQHFAKLLALPTIPPEKRKQMKAYYYGLAAWVDSQVGLVLDYVRKAGLAENTVLIFGADHGASLGESGAYAKFLFNRASQRVPLIISVPGMRQGEVESEICSMIDFARTVFNILDVPVPEQFRGRNLFEKAEEEIEVFGTIGYGSTFSYPMQYDAVGTYKDGAPWPRRACIRTNRYRLDMNIRMGGKLVSEEEEDLFFVDRAKCPEESGNMAQENIYAEEIHRLRENLLKHCSNGKECSEEVLESINRLLVSKEFFKYLHLARDKKRG